MKKIILAAMALSLSMVLSAQRLTILHTNDTHSHIDPVRSGVEAGLGGVVERAAYIDSVRAADGKRNVLLVDAGDFSQGTSYFTKLRGDLEVELMNAMGYDVTALGNHEFDNGLDELARRLRDLDCPAVCANYEFTGGLNDIVRPYVIIRRGGMKIGVIGLLTDVSRVVEKHIADNLRYLDPAEVTNRYAGFLRNVKKCDMVICLSHLGYDGGPDTDMALAGRIRNVDLIIGGHSHTFLESPSVVSDLDGNPVAVVTDGCWGLYVGNLKAGLPE